MDTKRLPTKNNLIKIKNSIKQSKEGQLLLEQKRMILARELEKYAQEQQRLQEKSQHLLEDAYHEFKIASVEIGMEDMIDISDGIPIDDTLDIKYKTIMGVEIPSLVLAEETVKLNYGLYNTTASVDRTILKFMEVKKYIVELAQVENIISRLKQAIEKIQRRSNALKEVIIPNDEKAAKEIQDILDENEKEELIRLKKLKKKR